MEILRHTIIKSIILIIIPALLSIILNYFKFYNNQNFLFFFYFITKTASFPFVYLISFILLIKLFYINDFKCKICIFIFLIFVFSSSYSLSKFVKKKIQKPRPFVILIYEKYKNYLKIINKNYFKKNNKDFKNVPQWLLNYWGENIDYSFPSTHTVFVSNWILIFTILSKKKYSIFTIFLELWSIIVILSRIVLKMHDYIDIFFGVMFSLMIIIIIYYIFNKLLINKFLLKIN